MSDETDITTTTTNTLYGTAVGCVKNGQLYLSRRTETVIYPKKWQLIHGRMKKGELSTEAAMRLLEDQTELKIYDRTRYHFVNHIESSNHEFYYVYLVNLMENEIPKNTCDRFRGDWRTFDLEKAEVLDVVEGLRPIVKQLHKTKLKMETYMKNFGGKTVNEVLTEREARHLAQLGPKMTRLI